MVSNEEWYKGYQRLPQDEVTRDKELDGIQCGLTYIGTRLPSGLPLEKATRDKEWNGLNVDSQTLVQRLPSGSPLIEVTWDKESMDSTWSYKQWYKGYQAGRLWGKATRDKGRDGSRHGLSTTVQRLHQARSPMWSCLSK